MSAKANFKIHPLSRSNLTKTFSLEAFIFAPFAHVGSDYPAIQSEHHVRASEWACIRLPENDEFMLVGFGKLDIELPLHVLAVRRAGALSFRP